MQTRASDFHQEVLLPATSMWTSHVLKKTHCSETRRLVFQLDQSSDHEIEEAMLSLLCVRHRIAQIRGYRTWNEYAQRESLLSTPSAVSEFLSAAWSRLRPGVALDLERLSEVKQLEGLEGGPAVRPWDLPWLLEASNKSSEMDRKLEDYMTYTSLMRGVDLILSSVLGVSFVPEDPNPGEVWHPSVQKYTLQEAGVILGVLYLDPFARPGKAVNSAQFTLQGSKLLPGGARQVPVTSLVYGLPVGERGLSVSHAVTFMHEIGHAVHSLLSATALQHWSGTRGAVDFVEFPSHLFEHFVLDPDCLRGYASHSKTQQPMPNDVAEHFRKRGAKFAHIDAARHFMYAVIDQAFYDAPVSAGVPLHELTATDLYRRLAEATAPYDHDMAASGVPLDGPFTTLLGLAQPSKFDHLVHYGGSYYCYLFNRALSSHIWQQAFRTNPFSRSTGARLRRLLQGGSVIQSLEAIQELCPKDKQVAFEAQNVPLDAFVLQLNGGLAS